MNKHVALDVNKIIEENERLKNENKQLKCLWHTILREIDELRCSDDTFEAGKQLSINVALKYVKNFDV